MKKDKGVLSNMKNWFALIFVFVFLQSYGQEPISVFTRTHSTQVMVRWVPETPEQYLLGVSQGFRIKRKVNSINGVLTPDSTYRVLNTLPIKPSMDSTIWKQHANLSTEGYAGFLFEVIKERLTKTSGFTHEFTENMYESFNSLVDFNFQIAKLCALGYVDTNTQTGYVYEYKVEL
ncbi:MAG: hypothetical protein ACRCVT_03710, partial [Leadbetterella sp.]